MNGFRLGWPTVRFVILAVVVATGTLAFGNLAFGEAIRIVSPPSAANAEGDMSVTPDRSPLRIQYLIPASDFAGLPASQRYIAAFNFRSDRTQTVPVDWIIPHEQVWMSTTSKNSLTNVFDDNHGPNKALVFDGAMTFPFLGSGPAAGPRPFAGGTPLQAPFYYDPSQGNLLVELRDFDKNFPTPASIDVATIPGANIRTLLNIGNVNAATGDLVPNLFGPMQFEFVPEPSSVVLAGLAFLSLHSCRRKCGRHFGT